MKEQSIAIKINNLKKVYRLGQIGGNTLQETMQSVWARLRMKEDPNTKIGENQCLYRKTFMALNGIDLTIYKGESVGIIGSNGAGKSTLLKLLSRITAPTSGEIDIYGRVTSMLEVGTGFNGEMTGRENIYMNGAILGMTKEEIDAKMEQIIDFSEVREFIDTPVKRYSSGMYVKLAFAVAAHLDSDIMIMDEVLAVGDMKFQKKCLGRMGDAAKIEGKTLLYVSHNMETIRQLCTRCMVLHQGEIIYDGDVETAISIYMDTQGDVGCTYYDYSMNIGRFDGFNMQTQNASLNWLRILEKENVIYKAGELMQFQIEIVTKRIFEHLRLRFEIRYADGIPVGTVPDLDLGYIEAADIKRYRISFDTSLLTRGKYQVCIVLYEKNEFGTFENHDVILPAFTFEIEDYIDIMWDTIRWGHIKLPDMQCERLD